METSVLTPFLLCAPHFPSRVLSTWAEPGRAVRCAQRSPRAVPQGYYLGEKTHVTQQHSSPFLGPARSVSAYPFLKLLFLHHGDESCWISTLSTASTAILQVEENQLSILCKGHHDNVSNCLQAGKHFWLPPCHQEMKQTEQTCTSGSNFALLQHFYLSPFCCFCNTWHSPSCPLLLGSRIGHSVGTKYKMRNVLEERTNTNITSIWQWFSALVDEIQLQVREAAACRCVASVKSRH